MENLFRPVLETDEEDPPGFRAAGDRIGARAGGWRLGATLYRLPSGESICPYHWHALEEEMLVVISGTPSLRTPDGWRELEPGDVAAFVIGEAGAHQVANFSDEPADVLLVSANREADVCVYPDSGKVGVFSPSMRSLFSSESEVDYYVGESPPDRMPP